MFEPLLPLQFLRRAARLFPDKTAVIDGEHRYAYRQLEERVHRLSNALRQRGIGKGDKVAILSPNSHRMLEAFFAVPQIGAVLAPLNYRLTTPDFEYILDHAETKALLIDWEYAHQIAPLVERLTSLRHYLLLRDDETPSAALPAVDYEDALASVPANYPEAEAPVIDETDLATLNYTSGTTARPKGVMLTHRACTINAIHFMTSLSVRPTDVYLHTLPMFHANGWGGIWAVAGLGGTQVCLRRVEAQPIFELMQDEAVTLACAAPTVLMTLATFDAAYRLAAGVRIGTGGAAPAAAVLRRMEDLGIEVIHLYGLTETGPFLTSCEAQPAWDGLAVQARYRLKARQGIAQLFADVRVMDEKLCEVPMDGQTIGEIVARGNNVMEGYYKQPEETANVMRGGWFTPATSR